MITTDPAKVDLILQYTLRVAAEQDDFGDRQLGPIHLIKYVYLADLAYAGRNDGKTYTNVPWQFYKFGPWSQEVNSRIEPALMAIGAEKHSFSSNYGDDDWVRWSVGSGSFAAEMERSLPYVITTHLRRYIHKFGKDTPSLLDYVYSTEPMLEAAPNEYLDFSATLKDNSGEAQSNDTLRFGQLSAKRQKEFRSRMSELRQKQKARFESGPKVINPVTHPQYDAVFSDGLKWLDELAGDPIEPGEVVAEFSPDVWKSATRKGSDVP